MESPIRRALVSVSDKTQLSTLAEVLVEHKVEVLSTGGTYKALQSHGVAVVRVSEYTGSPEILGGRVKTLHPRIHGGILALPTDEHRAELTANDIPPIDLVVVNLYPFKQVVARPQTSFAEAVENIDIGGPTMLRAAAKNWNRVAVVVDPDDYSELAQVLRSGGGKVPGTFRRRLSRKAFAHTASYDAAIAAYLSRYDDEGEAMPADAVPRTLWVGGDQPPAADDRVTGVLRYGENPHQSASFVRLDDDGDARPGLADAIVHQGKALSYNNLLDADAALDLIRDLQPLGTAAAVFKHATPCGAAIGKDAEALADVYVRARQADAESAFGGIVSLTHRVDAATASRLVETFLEVIIAPAYEAEALEVLEGKKNLRVLELAEMFKDSAVPAPLRVRSVASGLLVQREDRIGTGAADAKVVTRRAPSTDELAAMELGWVVCKHARSNAVVFAKDRATVGIGGGQTSRVEASRQAASRAGDLAQGAVLASDGFFPFADGVEEAAKVGVTAVIQPGGSKRDAEVIAAADELGMAMLVTGERHFRH